MPLEHGVDRVEMRVAHALEQEISRACDRAAEPRSPPLAVADQQLRDDLVGAREVEQSDVGEVDDGERALFGVGELLLDAAFAPRHPSGA